MTTIEAAHEVANTIREQIGNRAFVMIGASNFVGSENTLTFKVGRNTKSVTHIRVTLDASDTYTVTALSCRRRYNKPAIIESGEMSGVYADQLCSALTALTGLYTSF